MTELSDDLEPDVSEVAEHAVQQYARGLLPSKVLAAQIAQEWAAQCSGGEKPSKSVLHRIAQRVCSRVLYEAWSSRDLERRERAFDNLRHFLAVSLKRIPLAKVLIESGGADDVLQQTLLELYNVIVRNAAAGPDDPATFLKWAQTILIRQVYAFVEKGKRDTSISLDEQPKGFIDCLLDTKNDDPEYSVFRQELQDAVKNVILSMSNLRYRQVLICTYLAGMDDSEIADYLHARVQDVYLWRHRALKALRSKPEVMLALWRLLH